ncbi:MerR family transcriptional regulator [Dictyobacter alpinus]|uniref:MerR family transcriptional regulator n=1 Tax=Dictyobacter alpinus TaxID=2014873 RepID=A0A402B107_9CHLR|nr:MerR family transcriptional regulator [Dictyobacter alpinus]GCE25040.1 MerR family transcriptional regulator [Dictyobacter alpinus]
MTLPLSFTIQELSKQSGLSEPTLRYYEKIGLIQPVPRDPSSGHRRYPATTAQVVNALACLRASGLSIEDMRTYLQLLEKGTQGAAQQKELFQAHATELEHQIERLQMRKQYLEGKVAYWDALERGDEEAVQRIIAENHRIAEEIVKG